MAIDSCFDALFYPILHGAILIVGSVAKQKTQMIVWDEVHFFERYMQVEEDMTTWADDQNSPPATTCNQWRWLSHCMAIMCCNGPLRWGRFTFLGRMKWWVYPRHDMRLVGNEGICPRDSDDNHVTMYIYPFFGSCVDKTSYFEPGTNPLKRVLPMLLKSGDCWCLTDHSFA